MKQQENNLGRIWFEFYPFTMTGSTYYNAQSHEIQKKNAEKNNGHSVARYNDILFCCSEVWSFAAACPTCMVWTEHCRVQWGDNFLRLCHAIAAVNIDDYSEGTERAVYFIECTHSLLWLFKYIGIIFQFELLLLQCSNECEAFCVLQQSTQYAMQCTH